MDYDTVRSGIDLAQSILQLNVKHQKCGSFGNKTQTKWIKHIHITFFVVVVLFVVRKKWMNLITVEDPNV